MTLNEDLKNSKGTIFYGLHFCPGVAQYDNPEGSFKVFVNEATIRKMNPTFAGRPVFVEHVEEVDDNLNRLRGEVDGWVIESFYNAADGKTWAKFIIVSEQGLAAIRRGFRLSNAYVPQLHNTTAIWNGVEYQKEVIDGEFEHLAIVKNPRYDESVIMSPEEFKKYNDGLTGELKRIANSKDTKGENKMGKFNIFKRKIEKLENSLDLENMIVELPLSKKEVTLANALVEYDKILNMHGYANGDHMVKVGDGEMSVNDLVKKHLEACNSKGDEGGEPGKGEDEVGELEVAENTALDIDQTGDVGDRGGDKSLDNAEVDVPKKDDKDKMKNETDKKAAEKAKADAKAKAAALKNAHQNAQNQMEAVRVDLAEDQVARGKSRYGSN